MAVKYECPKCNRRFTEWGAEKFKFKCPADQWCPEDRAKEIDLLRVGASDVKPGKKASLKRGTKRAMPIAAPIETEEEEVMTADFEPAEDDADLDELPLAAAGKTPVDFVSDAPELAADEPAEADIDVVDDVEFGEGVVPPVDDAAPDAEEAADEWQP